MLQGLEAFPESINRDVMQQGGEPSWTLTENVPFSLEKNAPPDDAVNGLLHRNIHPVS